MGVVVLTTDVGATTEAIEDGKKWINTAGR